MAGERRLRACQLAKMTTISAILCSYADDRTAALGLLENIQRADLNPFEQAQGLRDVMVLWDCTQAEAAKRLGTGTAHLCQQAAAVAADRRPAAVRAGQQPHRAPRPRGAAPAGEPPQRGAHHHRQAPPECPPRLTATSRQLLNSPPKAGHRISMVRDVRIFVNTIDHAIRLMTDNGVPATAHRKRRTATSSTPSASPPPPRRSELFHVEQGRGEEDVARDVLF